MKAYLIDAVAKTVTEVEHNGDYREIYTFLGCDLFTVVRLDSTESETDRGDGLFVDDEGLMKPQAHFFKIAGFDQPLAGNGLVLGTDDEGESTAPAMTLAELQAIVTFHSAEELGFDPNSAPMDQTDEFDPVFISWEDFTASTGNGSGQI